MIVTTTTRANNINILICHNQEQQQITIYSNLMNSLNTRKRGFFSTTSRIKKSVAIDKRV